MTRFVVWGRTAKRSGSKADLKWKIALVFDSAEEAHLRARELVTSESDWRCWNYSLVLPAGVQPGRRQNEDYCRWTVSADFDEVESASPGSCSGVSG